MSIALLISERRDLAELLPWAIPLARARGQSLLLIQLQRKGNQKQRQLVQPKDNGTWDQFVDAAAELERAEIRLKSDTEQPDESEAERGLTYEIVQLTHPHLATAVGEELARSRAEAMLLRRDATEHADVLDRSLLLELINEVSCELIQIHPGTTNVQGCRSIMVPMGSRSHSAAALILAMNLSECSEATVCAVYVEPKVDEYAQQVGQRILDRQVEKTIGGHADKVKRRVVLDNKVNRGIRSIIDEFDTVILGIRHRGKLRRWLVKSLSEDLLSLEEGPTVIAVRPATPFAGRVVRSLDRVLRNGIPQLDRNQRIAVVERIQSSSKWDFDFIALVCLSTLIAAGGLIQNSSAVVIGAMLVAPLMTPLLGAGLSLVQGNLVLLRNTSQSVLRGFLLAVALSFAMGWCCPGLSTTTEMAARGAPGVLDLLVAFISGIAAAYAIGRPNLISALPGVAIAAALVPPIATVGLSLAIGHWAIAAGAALLFLTNIVAIVLGTACSFLAVGIRGSHAHGAFHLRSLRVAIGLVVVLLGLGVYESIPEDRLSESVESAIAELLAGRDAELVSIHSSSHPDHHAIRIVIESQHPADPELTDKLAGLVSDTTGEAVRVELETRLVTIVEP